MTTTIVTATEVAAAAIAKMSGDSTLEGATALNGALVASPFGKAVVGATRVEGFTNPTLCAYVVSNPLGDTPMQAAVLRITNYRDRLANGAADAEGFRVTAEREVQLLDGQALTIAGKTVYQVDYQNSSGILRDMEAPTEDYETLTFFVYAAGG